LWDLINKNNKLIPHYDDIALVSVAGGGAQVSNLNHKIENNRFAHKGKFPKMLFIFLSVCGLNTVSYYLNL